MEDALYLILTNQYMRAVERPHRVYAVGEGFGHGSAHAAAAADLAFYHTAEHGLLGHGPACGIVGYIRYRDDILVGARNDSRRSGVLRFMKMLCSRSRWWKVTAETVASTVQYLNLEISSRRGQIVVKPFIKDSRLNAFPLSPSSAHAKGVHRSWAGGTLASLYNLCTLEPQRVKICRLFSSMFTRSLTTLPDLPSPIFQGLRHSSLRVSNGGGIPQRIIWIKLLFHPLIGLE